MDAISPKFFRASLWSLKDFCFNCVNSAGQWPPCYPRQRDYPQAATANQDHQNNDVSGPIAFPSLGYLSDRLLGLTTRQSASW